MKAMPNCLRFEAHEAVRAPSRTRAKTGNRIPAKIAMMTRDDEDFNKSKSLTPSRAPRISAPCVGATSAPDVLFGFDVHTLLQCLVACKRHAALPYIRTNEIGAYPYGVYLYLDYFTQAEAVSSLTPALLKIVSRH
jgi:hypothetical protein